MRERSGRWLTDAVDLAQLLGSESKIIGLLGLLASDAEEEPPISPDKVVEATSVGHDIAVEVVEFLHFRRYTTENRNERSVNPDYDSCIELVSTALEAYRVIDRIDQTSSAKTVEFVCTLPTDDPAFESIDPVDFSMQQITTKLLSLCRTASEELLLTSPFLEVDGMEWLLPGLQGALERGVEVTFVSRELQPGQPNHGAVKELRNISENLPGELHIYDYYEPERGSRQPRYTLHSKLLVADGERAYVGSANFTRYGFSKNFELGVVVGGAEVRSLVNLLSHLVAESAIRISS